MSKPVNALLFWLPRTLGILFTLFISLFSLDVFEMGGGFWALLGGFLIHNIPTLILAAALVIGWRREWAGAVGFFGISLWFLSMIKGGEWIFGLIFIGVPCLVGILFLAGWFRRKKRGGA